MYIKPWSRLSTQEITKYEISQHFLRFKQNVCSLTVLGHPPIFLDGNAA